MLTASSYHGDAAQFFYDGFAVGAMTPSHCVVEVV